MSIIESIWRTLPEFLHAGQLTLALSAVSIAMALPLGLAIAVLSLSRFATVKSLGIAYIGLIRGTPLITQIFILYFGITTFLMLPAFWATAIALAAHISAYMAEIFRTGFQSIPAGLIEASRSLGMSRGRTFLRVQGPMALRVALPPLGNQFIIAIKDSSLAAFVTVPGLFFTARAFTAQTFQPMRFYVIVAGYYFIIILILTFLVRQLERHLNVDRR